jgi:hypothetical protein
MCETPTKRLVRRGRAARHALERPAMPVAIYFAIVVMASFGLLRWWLYLRLCRHIFDKTGDPAALRHVAVPARAFRESGVQLPRLSRRRQDG